MRIEKKICDVYVERPLVNPTESVSTLIEANRSSKFTLAICGSRSMTETETSCADNALLRSCFNAAGNTPWPRSDTRTVHRTLHYRYPLSTATQSATRSVCVEYPIVNEKTYNCVFYDTIHVE